MTATAIALKVAMSPAAFLSQRLVAIPAAGVLQTQLAAQNGRCRKRDKSRCAWLLRRARQSAR